MYLIIRNHVCIKNYILNVTGNFTPFKIRYNLDELRKSNCCFKTLDIPLCSIKTESKCFYSINLKQNLILQHTKKKKIKKSKQNEHKELLKVLENREHQLQLTSNNVLNEPKSVNSVASASKDLGKQVHSHNIRAFIANPIHHAQKLLSSKTYTDIFDSSSSYSQNAYALDEINLSEKFCECENALFEEVTLSTSQKVQLQYDDSAELSSNVRSDSLQLNNFEAEFEGEISLKANNNDGLEDKTQSGKKKKKKKNVKKADNSDSFNIASNKNKDSKYQKSVKKNHELLNYEELQLKKSKEAHLNSSLKAYLDVSVQAGMIERAHSTLLHYYNLGLKHGKYSVNSIDIFNILLNGWAKKGNLNRMKELSAKIRHLGGTLNLQSYAYFLECLHNQASINTKEAENILAAVKKQGFSLNDIITKCKFSGDQMEKITKVIKTIHPTFSFIPLMKSQEYICPLLNKLNEKPAEVKLYSPCEGVVDLKDLQSLSKDQIQMEVDGIAKVRSVSSVTKPSDRVIYLRKKLEEFEKDWRTAITNSFLRHLKLLQNRQKSEKRMLLCAYFAVLKPKSYIDIMMQEISALAQSSETFSPVITQLHQDIGMKVMARYFMWKKEQDGIADKVIELYKKYLEYYTSPELTTKYNPREYWEMLCLSHFNGPTIDMHQHIWPNHVLIGIGKLLYDIIIHETMIDANVMNSHSSTRTIIPAFYTVYRHFGMHIKEEIKPHPTLVKLYKEAAKEDLYFESSVMPMVSPPLPWTSTTSGGTILAPTVFIRLPDPSLQEHYMQIPNEQLYPSFDSLNTLGLCPWIINKPMLDIVLELFRNKGSDELDIPKPSSECPLPPKINAGMSKTEKFKAIKERMLLKKKKAEMFSLWCDALYKLSIANHCRDKIFWFPHNLDFRGRTYPTPPYFSHLGNDMCRSILLFAQGKPLGEKGLDWLKIHVINLTGLKKRESLAERLKFANEILPDIIDSADNPFTGKCWWMKSDEPWQTLACCKEIANVTRSADPVQYISHFPVHQDGSCNGLQHYAALGRDQQGAEQVNLHPADSPQDVYSGVAAIVERERSKDALENVSIACTLDGFITRKVVKQTVMTVVYGVTKYGARLQILKQLKDISEFPQAQSSYAASYIMQKIFLSLQEMFTSTRKIQNWFTDCARQICYSSGKPVEWITPLGLPIIQPYYRMSKSRGVTVLANRKQLNYINNFNTFEKPNILKQKNGFPPNFIHSLDAAHMMLTCLHCRREGISFVSVHDCYWTHPCSVNIMNTICREQFIALHKENILEDLSEFLIQKFCDSETDCNSNEIKKLRILLQQIPKKGTFHLDNVLQSTYFFS